MKGLESADNNPLPKMREDVFVDNIMKSLRVVLPAMGAAYDLQCTLGNNWDIPKLK